MKKTELLNLLSMVTTEKRDLNTHRHSRVLIVDGMNTFIRSFAADNKTNSYGHHVGGISGFLRSIGYAIKTQNPTRCIIVFDGEGGYTNRRYLYPEYKMNRDNTQKVMNWKSFNTKVEEDEHKFSELERLIDYLWLLPLTVIGIDKMEADDIIAYIVKKLYVEHDDSHITIMSTDNDFYQLINDRVQVYSPTKKKYYGIKELVEELEVYPGNYLLYKSLLGDNSDNIKGIHGLGDKTIKKLFPDIFKEKLPVTEKHIYNICESPVVNSILYQKILNQKHVIDINKKIMDLGNINLTESQSEEVDNDLKSHSGNLRKYDFITIYNADGMRDAIPNVTNWVDLFSSLNGY